MGWMGKGWRMGRYWGTKREGRGRNTLRVEDHELVDLALEEGEEEGRLGRVEHGVVHLDRERVKALRPPAHLEPVELDLASLVGARSLVGELDPADVLSARVKEEVPSVGRNGGCLRWSWCTWNRTGASRRYPWS